MLLFPSLYLLCSPNIHRFQTCWQCPQKETFFWQPTLNWAFTNRWGVIDWRYQPGVGCSRLDAKNEIISIASAGSVELWRSGSMGYLQGIESERADWMRHALKLNLPINQRTIYPASRWLPLVFRLHLLEGLNKKESVNFFLKSGFHSSAPHFSWNDHISKKRSFTCLCFRLYKSIFFITKEKSGEFLHEHTLYEVYILILIEKCLKGMFWSKNIVCTNPKIFCQSD